MHNECIRKISWILSCELVSVAVMNYIYFEAKIDILFKLNLCMSTHINFVKYNVSLWK
jgi:hypothetical protein